jgi:hypothetical protein
MNFISTIKSYLLSALGILAAAWTIYIAGRKAGGDAVKVKVEKKSAETQAKATDALISGLTHEQTELGSARARRKSHRVRNGSDND